MTAIENTYNLMIEEKGEVKMAKSGAVTGDKFSKLVNKIKLAKGEAVLSKVSMGTSETFECEGSRWVKVSAMVTLTCDQNEPKINEAGTLSFFKCQELTNDGLRAYGITE